MSHGAPDAGPERGFTLIECLVALVVMALGFSALYASYGGAVRGVGQADRSVGAVMLARNVLASVGSDIPLTPGRRDGTGDGGLLWTVETAPYADDRAVAGRIPMLVTVTVTHPAAGDAPLVALTTVKLGRVER